MEQGYHASAEGWQRQNCQQYQGTTASQRQGAGIQWKETFGYRFPPPKQQFQSPYVPEIPSSDNCFNPRYHYTRTTSSSESGRNHGTTTQFQPRSPQSFVNRSNPATAIFGQSRCDQNHQVPNDSWKLSSPSSLGCRSYPGVSGSSPCPREPPFGFPAGSGTSNRSFDHHHQSRLETYQPRYFNNNYIASASKPCRPRFVNSWNNSSRNKWHQHGRETNPNKKVDKLIPFKNLFIFRNQLSGI